MQKIAGPVYHYRDKDDLPAEYEDPEYSNRHPNRKAVSTGEYGFKKPSSCHEIFPWLVQELRVEKDLRYGLDCKDTYNPFHRRTSLNPQRLHFFTSLCPFRFSSQQAGMISRCSALQFGHSSFVFISS